MPCFATAAAREGYIIMLFFFALFYHLLPFNCCLTVVLSL